MNPLLVVAGVTLPVLVGLIVSAFKLQDANVLCGRLVESGDQAAHDDQDVDPDTRAAEVGLLYDMYGDGVPKWTSR